MAHLYHMKDTVEIKEMAANSGRMLCLQTTARSAASQPEGMAYSSKVNADDEIIRFYNAIMLK